MSSPVQSGQSGPDGTSRRRIGVLRLVDDEPAEADVPTKEHELATRADRCEGSRRESAMRAMRLTAFLALFLSLLVASATCQEVEDLAPELEACRAQVRTSDVYRQD